MLGELDDSSEESLTHSQKVSDTNENINVDNLKKTVKQLIKKDLLPLDKEIQKALVLTLDNTKSPNPDKV